MKNAATIDLEDYYQVTAFAQGGISPESNSHASRIAYSTAKLLDLLDGAKRKATFFTLGWAAGEYPELIRQIATRGHEIACHSNKHRLVHTMTPKEFRDDTLVARVNCRIPMPTLQIGNVRAPLGGGAYLRLLPYWFTRWGIRFINRKEDRPACVYLHPWELDAEQPRMSGSMSGA